MFPWQKLGSHPKALRTAGMGSGGVGSESRSRSQFGGRSGVSDLEAMASKLPTAQLGAQGVIRPISLLSEFAPNVGHVGVSREKHRRARVGHQAARPARAARVQCVGHRKSPFTRPRVRRVFRSFSPSAGGGSPGERGAKIEVTFCMCCKEVLTGKITTNPHDNDLYTCLTPSDSNPPKKQSHIVKGTTIMPSI